MKRPHFPSFITTFPWKPIPNNMANKTHVRDTCSTCNKKVKGPKVSCFACNKVLHSTPECTLTAEKDVKVLINDKIFSTSATNASQTEMILVTTCEQEPKTNVDQQSNRTNGSPSRESLKIY